MTIHKLELSFGEKGMYVRRGDTEILLTKDETVMLVHQAFSSARWRDALASRHSAAWREQALEPVRELLKKTLKDIGA